MSWLDKLTNDLIITTGDGKVYKPLWIRPNKSTDFNYAEFKFPNLEGSLVVRGTPIGRRFPLEIYFVGENHLDDARSFELSSNDKNYWEIQHPYYGLIFVQPTSISFDNSAENVSKINIQVIETITENYPKIKQDPLQSILIQKVELDSLIENDITATIKPVDINRMSDINNKSYNYTVPIIELPEEVTELNDYFNKASAAIATATASPVLAMRSALAVLNYPSNLQSSVNSRINVLQQSFDNLRRGLSTTLGVAGKQIYQSHGAGILSAMAVAAISPLSKDYTNNNIVLNVYDKIISNYNNFMADLDSIQTLNGGNVNSFIPSPDTLISLSNLINYTLSNLQSIALNSRVERSIITESDTNVILLTHRFYGLDPSDENINELIANNGWGLNSLIQIRKNTKVIYYI